MAQANASQQPNILILWGDDSGWWNISYNSREH
jgi:arylsulfatase A-like enzyme